MHVSGEIIWKVVALKRAGLIKKLKLSKLKLSCSIGHSLSCLLYLDYVHPVQPHGLPSLPHHLLARVLSPPNPVVILRVKERCSGRTTLHPEPSKQWPQCPYPGVEYDDCQAHTGLHHIHRTELHLRAAIPNKAIEGLVLCGPQYATLHQLVSGEVLKYLLQEWGDPFADCGFVGWRSLSVGQGPAVLALGGWFSRAHVVVESRNLAVVGPHSIPSVQTVACPYPGVEYDDCQAHTGLHHIHRTELHLRAAIPNKAIEGLVLCGPQYATLHQLVSGEVLKYLLQEWGDPFADCGFVGWRSLSVGQGPAVLALGGWFSRAHVVLRVGVRGDGMEVYCHYSPLHSSHIIRVCGWPSQSSTGTAS